MIITSPINEEMVEASNYYNSIDSIAIFDFVNFHIGNGKFFIFHVFVIFVGWMKIH